MWAALVSVFFIALFGLASLFGIRQDLLPNQLIYFLIGFSVFYITRKVGWGFFRNNAAFFYWFLTALLIVTSIVGVEIKGSKRWIDLYFINFQASELFKIFFAVFMADFLARNRKIINEPQVFFKSLVYFIIPTLLVFKQPDFGNAMVFVFVYAMTLIFSKIPRKTIVYTFVSVLATVPVLWFFLLADYQKDRILSFLNPQIDTQGSSYNMIQAMITVGSGKFFGRGLGHGTQSKLLYLPESHTDFAFSTLVEQFGFFGGFCILVLFLILLTSQIIRITKYYRRTDEDGYFRFLYSIGFFSYFIFQTFINIGMNLGLVPVVGVALPLISYGGSSLVAFAIGLALIF